MLQLPVEEVINKIHEETGLTKEEISHQIEEKKSKLDGLVSNEGAAYIIASELGVKLFKTPGGGALKIKNILVGMNNVEVLGKVTRVFEPRHFDKGANKGKVVSMMLSDETGTIRTVLWNEHVDLVESKKIDIGSTIKISYAYVKESSYSGKELHLGSRSKIMLNPEEDVDIPVSSIKLNKVSEIKPEDSQRLIGTVVQTFAPYFYNVCPTCRKKVVKAEDSFECKEHGKVNAEDAMLFSFVLDDGSGFVRCVCFGKRAESICGVDTKDALFICENKDEAVLKEKIDIHLLGRSIEVQGTARENKVFERVEMLVNQCNLNLNAKILARQMLKGD